VRWLAVAALLLLSGCRQVNDPVAPAVHWVFPHDGDTLEPGVYVLKAVATDDQSLRWISFWSNYPGSSVAIMLGLFRQSPGDTYTLGWDCLHDTGSYYWLSVTAEDRADNAAHDFAGVAVRRSRQPVGR
jgi:hypothetical protein